MRIITLLINSLSVFLIPAVALGDNAFTVVPDITSANCDSYKIGGVCDPAHFGLDDAIVVELKEGDKVITLRGQRSIVGGSCTFEVGEDLCVHPFSTDTNAITVSGYGLSEEMNEYLSFSSFTFPVDNKITAKVASNQEVIKVTSVDNITTVNCMNYKISGTCNLKDPSKPINAQLKQSSEILTGAGYCIRDSFYILIPDACIHKFTTDNNNIEVSGSSNGVNLTFGTPPSTDIAVGDDRNVQASAITKEVRIRDASDISQINCGFYEIFGACTIGPSDLITIELTQAGKQTFKGTGYCRVTGSFYILITEPQSPCFHNFSTANNAVTISGSSSSGISVTFSDSGTLDDAQVTAEAITATTAKSLIIDPITEGITSANCSAFTVTGKCNPSPGRNAGMDEIKVILEDNPFFGYDSNEFGDFNYKTTLDVISSNITCSPGAPGEMGTFSVTLNTCGKLKKGKIIVTAEVVDPVHIDRVNSTIISTTNSDKFIQPQPVLPRKTKKFTPQALKAY